MNETNPEGPEPEDLISFVLTIDFSRLDDYAYPDKVWEHIKALAIYAANKLPELEAEVTQLEEDMQDCRQEVQDICAVGLRHEAEAKRLREALEKVVFGLVSSLTDSTMNKVTHPVCRIAMDAIKLPDGGSSA